MTLSAPGVRRAAPTAKRTNVRPARTAAAGYPSAAMLRRLVLAGLILVAAPAPAAAAVRIFPSDRWTVRDPAQLTGLRVRLPLPDCTARPSDCAELQRLNRLDGFDVEPRVQVTFDRRVAVGEVRTGTLSLRAAGGGPAIGLDRLVWDPATRTLTGSPVRQLRPATRYRVRVAASLGGKAASATFTTMSTTAQLRRLAARVRASRPVLRVDGALPAGTPMTRLVDRGGTAPDDEPVPDLSATGAARYVFGALDVPTWLRANRTFAPAPTKRLPAPTGRASTSFALIVPAGAPPSGGWPVAIFGHGFLRSHYDLFLAARGNAARGIATIAIDAVGHGGGPRGAIIGADGTTIPAPGRGRDTDGDGTIGDLENLRTPPQPDPEASVLLRDSLRQTALDTVALATVLRAGVPALPELSRTNISYYGQSLGGIYGTIVAAIEPRLVRSVLNVPGGPLVDIVRLSPGFRPLLLGELAARRPPIMGPSATLDEQLPLRGEPPVTAPTAVALAAQQVIARMAWLQRSGSPEAYAPLLRRSATLVQVAFGDQTVPNPTSDEIVRAGGLARRTWVFRNDRTPTADSNPHGFLLDAASSGNILGQAQMLTFLQTGRIGDPDGPAQVFEPLQGDLLWKLNF